MPPLEIGLVADDLRIVTALVANLGGVLGAGAMGRYLRDYSLVVTTHHF